MVVSVMAMPAEFTTKSSPLWINPGNAVHQHPLPLGGNNVEDDGPALAVEIGRSNCCGRLRFCHLSYSFPSQRMRCNAPAQPLPPAIGSHVLVILLDVIFPLSCRHSRRRHPTDRSSRLLRSRHPTIPCSSSRYSCSMCGHIMVLRGLAKELPVFLVVVSLFQGSDFQHVLDFRRHQIAVLEPDLGRRAFEMDESPSIPCGLAKTLLQTRIARGILGGSHDGKHGKQGKNSDYHAECNSQSTPLSNEQHSNRASARLSGAAGSNPHC